MSQGDRHVMPVQLPQHEAEGQFRAALRDVMTLKEAVAVLADFAATYDAEYGDIYTEVAVEIVRMWLQTGEE